MGPSHHFFCDFKITFLATSLHGDVQVIFKDATEIQNGHQRSTPKFFVGRKNFKTSSQKLFKFYNHIPHDMEMCRCFFKVSLKLKMAATSGLEIGTV